MTQFSREQNTEGREAVANRVATQSSKSSNGYIQTEGKMNPAVGDFSGEEEPIHFLSSASLCLGNTLHKFSEQLSGSNEKVFRGTYKGEDKRQQVGMAVTADPVFWSPFLPQQEPEVRKGEVLLFLSVL